MDDLGYFAPERAGWPILGLDQLQSAGTRLPLRRLCLGVANLLVAIRGALLCLQVARNGLQEENKLE